MFKKTSCKISVLVSSLAIVVLVGCWSNKKPHTVYLFPNNVWIDTLPTEPYRRLGVVKTMVNFPLDSMMYDDAYLCKNYFNKAAADLLVLAKKHGGSAVIEMRTMVLLFDGTLKEYKTAECADDGVEAQILVQGAAIAVVSK